MIQVENMGQKSNFFIVCEGAVSMHYWCWRNGRSHQKCSVLLSFTRSSSSAVVVTPWVRCDYYVSPLSLCHSDKSCFHFSWFSFSTHDMQIWGSESDKKLNYQRHKEAHSSGGVCFEFPKTFHSFFCCRFAPQQGCVIGSLLGAGLIVLVVSFRHWIPTSKEWVSPISWLSHQRLCTAVRKFTHCWSFAELFGSLITDIGMCCCGCFYSS